VVTYDKELGYICMVEKFPLDLDEDCLLNDVHVAINNIYIFIITHNIIMAAT
jgi:hypothetical protein